MSEVTRRDALKLLAAAAATGCVDPKRANQPKNPENAMNAPEAARPDAIVRVMPLGFQWETPDPFLFCVHHDDRYPAGNTRFGPAASLAGHDLGQDFAGVDGWRMYHGRIVPGFPQHPHRGFETVTIVRQGLLDHSDSLGAAARYGRGDVQWLTAGRGILHAEMFPLLDKAKANRLELFQIWVNLPRVNKLVVPHFTMLWDSLIPRHVAQDEAGRTTEVTVIAGRVGEDKAPAPPPNSWAAQEKADFAIWTIRMAPGATWTLPPAVQGSNRRLYFFRGSGLKLGGRSIPDYNGVELRAELPIRLENGATESELLLLQGRPIAEPVVQYGPFVMNSREEIRQTFEEYQQTHFGGWPWESDDPVHGAEPERFARRPDGKVERPG